MTVEVRCSSHHGASFYYEAVKRFLYGTMDNSGEQSKEPVGEVKAIAYGSAVSVCIGAAARLEKDGLAKIRNIKTGLTMDDLKKRPSVAITLRKPCDSVAQ